MKRPELLAPAGNYSSLIAAIQGGCDAIYLSGKRYGARNFAGNFSDDELISAIKYAHLYGVKIYVTVNTLIYEDEIPNFIKYIDFLYTNNVDAIIIQDIGMFDLIRKLYPNLDIHISTQMHIHNLEGCELVRNLGATRVVLARETPIELVKKIKNNCNIEIEVFVHGALCISYSGQCLMSSLIGGRSGNRGTCAQCCRQPYDLYVNDKCVNSSKYLLSTKDLNTLELLGQLIDIGVDSFKIEGRMKRPEYVYYVVSLYRHAIDCYLEKHKIEITDQDLYDLKKIFNREFTKGFMFHETNDKFVNSFRPNHVGVEIGQVIKTSSSGIEIKLVDDLNLHDGIRILGDQDLGLEIQQMYKNKKKIVNAYKGDIIFIPIKKMVRKGSTIVKTSDYQQLMFINNKINSMERKVPITMVLVLKIGQPLKLHVVDDINNNIDVTSDFFIEKSINSSTSFDTIRKNLSKTGDTIYKPVMIDIGGDKNIFIPIKEINELRRKALERLNTKRLNNFHRDYIKGEYNIELPDFPLLKNRNIFLSNFSSKNLDIYNEIIISKDQDMTLTNKKYRKKLSRVNEYLKEEKGNLLAGELGSIQKYVRTNDVATDFSLNVTNSYTVALLHSLGVTRVTLSLELNDYQIKKIVDNYHQRYNKHPNLELIVSGPIEVMVSKYRLLDKYNLVKNAYLKDKFGNRFKIKEIDNLTYIYHYHNLNLNNQEKYYQMGINNLRDEC